LLRKALDSFIIHFPTAHYGDTPSPRGTTLPLHKSLCQGQSFAKQANPLIFIKMADWHSPPPIACKEGKSVSEALAAYSNSESENIIQASGVRNSYIERKIKKEE
jgi:hypothetical protein